MPHRRRYGENYDTHTETLPVHLPTSTSVASGARAGMHIYGSSLTNQVVYQDTKVHRFAGNLHRMQVREGEDSAHHEVKYMMYRTDVRGYDAMRALRGDC